MPPASNSRNFHRSKCCLPGLSNVVATTAPPISLEPGMFAVIRQRILSEAQTAQLAGIGTAYGPSVLG